MKVLVTGLSGFTGQYLKADLINAGHTVYGLQSNLLDENALREELLKVQPDAIAHLAAISFVQHNNLNEIYQVNLVGTQNLLSAVYTSVPDIQSFLLASSANVYGNKSGGKISESAPFDPCNDYAVSKVSMEMMARLWTDRLPLFITRPFNYTGVGQTINFLIPKVVDHFKRKEKKLNLGNIDVKRDFSDVRFVSSCYRHLLEAPPVGDVLNICSGVSYSIKEIIDYCEKITEHQIEVSVNPLFVRSNEVKELLGDNQKLISYMPQVNLMNFKDTLNWMLT
ncbi:GDP-6-deoxy-D-lyxo-4-hexulose reductase [Terasakiella brassicae]|uniref:GDP-6-deoxy-D-lyxo-4-hexulose reductase n=1 Tax=Terasakiella brassicae TaxID=1634917 RepID=A0A917C0M5_9PROT|nr:GDP-mannose 4,6-dehydratase [Terasakiella brassicae]GGF66570.1 GDP-6-deoxy-D-lyxo-4-hexulose reductase [Terasakiella brassicae]